MIKASGTTAAGKLTGQLFLVGAILLTCTGLSCATIAPGYGKLEGVVVNGTNAPNPSSTDLRITRPSGTVAPNVGMAIRKSDTISTSRNAQALMTLLESYEVTLDTGTVIIIENPSIFVRFGQLFIRKLTGKPDTMTVHTGHVTILDKGTAFFVRVVRDDSSQVFVAEGAVTVYPRTEGAWAPKTYGQGRGGTFVGSNAPIRMEVAPAVMEAELSRVRRVDALTRVRMPRLDSLTEADARAALQRVGLRVLLVQKRVTGNVAAGRVIDQFPSAGEYAPVNSFVSLTIEGERTTRDVTSGSTPPPDRTRADTLTGRSCGSVPNVVNASEAEAIKMIKDAGYEPRRDGNGDYVEKQNPTPTRRARCGQTVVYTLAYRIR